MARPTNWADTKPGQIIYALVPGHDKLYEIQECNLIRSNDNVLQNRLYRWIKFKYTRPDGKRQKESMNILQNHFNLKTLCISGVGSYDPSKHKPGPETIIVSLDRDELVYFSNSRIIEMIQSKEEEIKKIEQYIQTLSKSFL